MTQVKTRLIKILIFAGVALCTQHAAHATQTQKFPEQFIRNRMRDALGMFIFDLQDLSDHLMAGKIVHAPYRLAYLALIAKNNNVFNEEFPKTYFIKPMKTPEHMTVLQWIQLQWRTLHNIFTQSKIKLTVPMWGEQMPIDSPRALKNYFESQGLKDPDALWVYIQFLEQTGALSVHEGGLWNILKDGIKRKTLEVAFKTPSKPGTRKLCEHFTPAKVEASITELTKVIEKKYETQEQKRRDRVLSEDEQETPADSEPQPNVHATPVQSSTPKASLLDDAFPLSPIALAKTPLAYTPKSLDPNDFTSIFDLLDEGLSRDEQSTVHWADVDEASTKDDESNANTLRKESTFEIHTTIKGTPYKVDRLDESSYFCSQAFKSTLQSSGVPFNERREQGGNDTSFKLDPLKLSFSPEAHDKGESEAGHRRTHSFTSEEIPVEEITDKSAEQPPSPEAPGEQYQNQRANSTGPSTPLPASDEPSVANPPHNEIQDDVGPSSSTTTAELKSTKAQEEQPKQNDEQVSPIAIGAVAGAVVVSLGLVAHATHLTDGVFYALTGRLTQRAKQTLAHDIATATAKCTTQQQLHDTHISIHKRFLPYHTDDVEQIYTMAEALTTAAAA